jgi:hypothetical protein
LRGTSSYVYKKTVPPDASQIAKLRQSVRLYEGAVATFERARDTMQKRRRGASDSVMVHLDESLKLNQRALESLRRVLETAKADLAKALNER